MSTGADLEVLLGRARRNDGGFGPSPGAASEPEPTALAAIALADGDAADWLGRYQAADGALDLIHGTVVNQSATALATWSLTPQQRDLALDHLESTRAAPFGVSDVVELDGSKLGWPFVAGTAAWVDPTCRALLALRRFRPDSPLIGETVDFLADRACVGGGWNYGNRTVYDTDLDPYVHPTALACLALDGSLAPQLHAAGLAVLEQRWRDETGVLSLALTTAVFRSIGHRHAADATDALAAEVELTGALGDTVALAWALIAVTDRLWEVLP